jgi:hypothetical protein
MADYLPVYTPGQAFTSPPRPPSPAASSSRSPAPAPSAPPPPASVKVVGVAAFDAASGARVTIWGRPGPRGHRLRQHHRRRPDREAAANGQVTAYTAVTTPDRRRDHRSRGKAALTTATNGNLVRFLAR